MANQFTLTRSNLQGVWPALLTPWTEDDRIDEARLSAEIAAMGAEGVHGTYTGGTAGEFYAQDDATFEQLTEIACREAHRADLPIQIGCTALSTRVVKNRVRIALRNGADAIQLALPFWLPLADEEVYQFFRDVAQAAGDTPLVLYQTMRAKRRVDPPLLGELSRATPTLIGIKDTGCDYDVMQRIVADAPDLAVFGTDVDFLERMRLGARGTYSSVAGLNAGLMLAIYHHCAADRFDLAEPLQDAVRRLMYEVLHPISREEGLLDSALDKLQRFVGGGLIGLRCQRPYRSATQQHVERVRQWCQREAPVLLTAGSK
ncbi:MAG: dihydrodipicolinate synthase family protein [Pirellulales bacterium]|nr:dihydrodipicolinate synthase family protein [Pirellulales bacterium]